MRIVQGNCLYAITRWFAQYSGATEARSDRSMEDLKARYYSIARQLMISREGNQEDIENRTLIKSPFDANHEK